jgi:hypothetical protein
MPPLAAALPGILISLAISAAFTIISRLLAPHQASRPAIGNQLPTQKDPGVELTVRAAGEPHQIVFGRRRVKGNIVFAHCTNNNQRLNLAIEWAGHEVAALEELYFDDEEVPLIDGGAQGKYLGHVGCYDNLGTDDQTAIQVMLDYTSDILDSNFRGRGKAWSYIQLNWNREKFPQGLPNIWRVVKGMKVYDPRDDSTGWSSNAILCAAAFMNNSRYGRGIPYGGLNGIDTDALIAAANICDEDVPKADETTEKRYTCHAVLSSDTDFEENLAKLLSASAGTMTPIGGAWIPDVAAWEEPEVVFDADDFLEGFQLQNGLGAADSFNAIKGKYANPDKNYQPDDFPAIISSAYEIEDGGDGDGSGRVFKDVALECTTSPSAAQRLARIDLRRSRQPLTFEAKFKLRALQTTPGRNVAINFGTPLLWELKAFRVERMKLLLGFGPDGTDGSGGEPGIIGAVLTLRETAAEIYDWDAAIDESGVDITPNTNLPDVFTSLPASNLRASESVYATRDGGGVKAKLRMEWDASPDSFVTSGGHYRPSYRLSGATEWTLQPDTTALFSEVFDIDPGLYELRIEAINWAGVASTAVVVSMQVAGLSAPPAAPTNFQFSAVGLGTVALLRWDRSLDLDVLQGGRVYIRHSSLTSGATWADSVSIAEPLDGGQTLALVPLRVGTYLLKFVDSTGNWSDPATIVADQYSSLAFATLVTVTESPAFSGTKVGCVVDDGTLMIDSIAEFDGVADVDGLVSWDWSGGVLQSGTYVLGDPAVPFGLGVSGGFFIGHTGSAAQYTFANVLDLTVAAPCRLTASIESFVENVLDDFDTRSGDSDSWASWDGDVAGNEADAKLYVQTTDDDPTSLAATWSGTWMKLDTAEFNKRGYKFMLELDSFDPLYNINVYGLAVVAEAP